MDNIKSVNNVEDKEPEVDTEGIGEIPADTPEEILEVVLSGDAEGEVPATASQSDEYYELSGLTEAQRKRKAIFDKITTGILIALLASPILILAYIFLWFIFK